MENVSITVTRLESGYFRIAGIGPCEWAQPSRWPCSEDELRASAFPEASECFICAAMRVAQDEHPKETEAPRASQGRDETKEK